MGFSEGVLNQLVSWFDEYDIKYANDAKTGVLHTDILSDLGVDGLMVNVEALDDTYLVKAFYEGVIVPEQRRSAMMEFILRVNVLEMYLSFDFGLGTVVSTARGESFSEGEMLIDDLQCDSELAASRITDFLPFVRRVLAGENPEKVAADAMEADIGEISSELFPDDDWDYLDDDDEYEGGDYYDEEEGDEDEYEDDDEDDDK